MKTFLATLAATLTLTGCLSQRIGTAIKLRDARAQSYKRLCVGNIPPLPVGCMPCYTALQNLKKAIQAADLEIRLPGSNREQSTALRDAVVAVRERCPW